MEDNVCGMRPQERLNDMRKYLFINSLQETLKAINEAKKLAPDESYKNSLTELEKKFKTLKKIAVIEYKFGISVNEDMKVRPKEISELFSEYSLYVTNRVSRYAKQTEWSKASRSHTMLEIRFRSGCLDFGGRFQQDTHYEFMDELMKLKPDFVPSDYRTNSFYWSAASNASEIMKKVNELYVKYAEIHRQRERNQKKNELVERIENLGFKVSVEDK